MRFFMRRARRAEATSRAEAANYKAREYLREKRAEIIAKPAADLTMEDVGVSTVLVTLDYLLSGRGEEQT